MLCVCGLQEHTANLKSQLQEKDDLIGMMREVFEDDMTDTFALFAAHVQGEVRGAASITKIHTHVAQQP